MGKPLFVKAILFPLHEKNGLNVGMQQHFLLNLLNFYLEMQKNL